MTDPLRIDQLDGTVTTGQAFRALEKFLKAYFDRTAGRGALATIVGDVELERDGTSTDPAALSDWLACVSQVLQEDAEGAR
jgi:hypothetical protein